MAQHQAEEQGQRYGVVEVTKAAHFPSQLAWLPCTHLLTLTGGPVCALVPPVIKPSPLPSIACETASALGNSLSKATPPLKRAPPGLSQSARDELTDEKTCSSRALAAAIRSWEALHSSNSKPSNPCILSVVPCPPYVASKRTGDGIAQLRSDGAVFLLVPPRASDPFCNWSTLPPSNEESLQPLSPLNAQLYKRLSHCSADGEEKEPATRTDAAPEKALQWRRSSDGKSNRPKQQARPASNDVDEIPVVDDNDEGIDEVAHDVDAERQHCSNHASATHRKYLSVPPKTNHVGDEETHDGIDDRVEYEAEEELEHAHEEELHEEMERQLGSESDGSGDECSEKDMQSSVASHRTEPSGQYRWNLRAKTRRSIRDDGPDEDDNRCNDLDDDDDSDADQFNGELVDQDVEPFAYSGAITMGSLLEVMGPDEEIEWARSWRRGTVHSLGFKGRNNRLVLSVHPEDGDTLIEVEVRGAKRADEDLRRQVATENNHPDASESEVAVLPSQPMRKLPTSYIAYHLHNRVRPVLPVGHTSTDWAPTTYEAVEVQRQHKCWAPAIVRESADNGSDEVSVRLPDSLQREDLKVRTAETRPALEWLGPAKGWRRAPAARKHVTQMIDEKLGSPQEIGNIYTRFSGRKRKRRNNEEDLAVISAEGVESSETLPPSALGVGVVESGTEVEWLETRNGDVCWRPARVHSAHFVEGSRARVSIVPGFDVADTQKRERHHEQEEIETGEDNLLTFTLGEVNREADTGRLILPPQPKRALPNSFLKYHLMNVIRPRYPHQQLATFEPIQWASVEVGSDEDGWRAGFLRSAIKKGKATVRFPDSKRTRECDRSSMRVALEWAGATVGWKRAPAARLDVDKKLTITFDAQSGLYIPDNRNWQKRKLKSAPKDNPQKQNQTSREMNKCPTDFYGRPDQSPEESKRVRERLRKLSEPFFVDSSTQALDDEHAKHTEHSPSGHVAIGSTVEVFEPGTKVAGRWRLAAVDRLERTGFSHGPDQVDQSECPIVESDEAVAEQHSILLLQQYNIEIRDIRTGKVRTLKHPLLCKQEECSHRFSVYIPAQLTRSKRRGKFPHNAVRVLRPVPPVEGLNEKDWDFQYDDAVEACCHGGWWSGYVDALPKQTAHANTAQSTDTFSEGNDFGRLYRIYIPDTGGTVLVDRTALRPAFEWHGPQDGFMRAHTAMEKVMKKEEAREYKKKVWRNQSEHKDDQTATARPTNPSRYVREVNFDEEIKGMRTIDEILAEPPEGIFDTDISSVKALSANDASVQLTKQEAASCVAERWSSHVAQIPEEHREAHGEHWTLKGQHVRNFELAVYEVYQKNKSVVTNANVSMSDVIQEARSIICSRFTRKASASRAATHPADKVNSKRPVPRKRRDVKTEQMLLAEQRQLHTWAVSVCFTGAFEETLQASKHADGTDTGAQEACTQLRTRRWAYLLVGMRDGNMHAWCTEAPRQKSLCDTAAHDATVTYRQAIQVHCGVPVISMSRVDTTSDLIVTGSTAGDVKLWRLAAATPEDDIVVDLLAVPLTADVNARSPVITLTGRYITITDSIAVGMGMHNGGVKLWHTSWKALTNANDPHCIKSKLSTSTTGMSFCGRKYENCMGIALIAPEARLRNNKPLAILACFGSGSVAEYVPCSDSESLMMLNEPVYTMDGGPTDSVIGATSVCASPNDGVLAGITATVHEPSRRNVHGQRSVSRLLLPAASRGAGVDSLKLALHSQPYVLPLLDIALSLRYNDVDNNIKSKATALRNVVPDAVGEAALQQDGRTQHEYPVGRDVWRCSTCGVEAPSVDKHVPVCPYCHVLAEPICQ